MATCAACNSIMGHSEASFTSECSHVFHPSCVSGRTTCPSCDTSWRHTPTFSPASYSSYSPLLPQPPRVPLAIDAFHVAPSLSTCAACQSFAGDGISRAIFKAECHHTFHLTCVMGSVCPICSARWAYDVTSYPTLLDYDDVLTPLSFLPVPPPLPFPPVLPPLSFPPVLDVYDDDEPLDEPPASHRDLEDWDLVQDAADGGGKLVLDMHCEHTAVGNGKPHDNFVVLVRAKAPGAATEAAADETRAPLDLVTVLDVSGSMKGDKIALLKKAMEFVVDQLGPADRLSVVAFSTYARLVIPLMRMSGTGKIAAKGAIQLLQADDGFSSGVGHSLPFSFTALLRSVQGDDGGTNILKGLGKASKVLHGRRQKNAVASVIVLSDGHDTCNLSGRGYPYVPASETKKYRDLVLHSLFLGGEGDRSTPIHTFGFGADHDVCALHSIAEETGGTYSFIENHAVVHDYFAQCTGGLPPVAAVQEAWISVDCAHPGVRIRAIQSGRYKSGVEAYGRKASLDVGELYADEERRLMLLLDVPRAGDADDVTQLIKVTCTYRDTATAGQVVTVDVAVRRPVELAAKDQQQQRNMEAAWEKLRVEGTEDIAEARAAAVRDVTEAARILDGQRNAVLLPELSWDARCLMQEVEHARVAPGCLPPSGLSSHSQQRAGGSAFMDTLQEQEDFRAAYPSPAVMRLARERYEQRMKEEDFTAMTSFGATAAASPSPTAMRMAREMMEQRIKQEDFSAKTAFGATAEASPSPTAMRTAREMMEEDFRAKTALGTTAAASPSPTAMRLARETLEQQMKQIRISGRQLG